MTVLRRTAPLNACTTVAAMLAKTEALVGNPKLADIQALVSELRNIDEVIPASVWFYLQEVADRLETLPGIGPVPNENWSTWKSRLVEPVAGQSFSGSYLATACNHRLTGAQNKSKKIACMPAQRAGPPDGLTSNGP